MTRVLIIASAKDNILEIKDSLDFEGYETVISSNGKEGLMHAQEEPYDLIIVDTKTSEITGCEVLREFRKLNKETPLIILSENKSEEEKVFCLNLGADDYMLLPLSVPELVARTRAHIRRVKILKSTYSVTGGALPGYEPVTIKIGESVIYLDRMAAKINGVENPLTPKEIGIIRLLYKNRGKVVPREAMMKEIWGNDIYITERVIDTNIVSIRKKIGDAGRKARYIKTVFGVGYKLVEG